MFDKMVKLLYFVINLVVILSLLIFIHILYQKPQIRIIHINIRIFQRIARLIFDLYK